MIKGCLLLTRVWEWESRTQRSEPKSFGREGGDIVLLHKGVDVVACRIDFFFFFLFFSCCVVVRISGCSDVLILA